MLRKIEEESTKSLNRDPSVNKKGTFKQNVTVWAVSIASIFIIGILSATFLLSDKSEQAAEGEITEQFLLQLEESYKVEREKRREMLKMDEERFAEINFIRSADRAASLLVSDDNVNILSSYSTRKEILQEQFERLTFELMLPSEMHYSLLNYQLTGDEQGSIEFLRFVSK